MRQDSRQDGHQDGCGLKVTTVLTDVRLEGDVSELSSGRKWLEGDGASPLSLTWRPDRASPSSICVMTAILTRHLPAMPVMIARHNIWLSA